MKHLFGQQLYWRDLDVRQVVYWPNAPRRWLLALLSVLLFAGLVALLVWPKLIQLRDEQARIQNAQNLIEQALRVSPNVLDQVPRFVSFTPMRKQYGWQIWRIPPVKTI